MNGLSRGLFETEIGYVRVVTGFDGVYRVDFLDRPQEDAGAGAGPGNKHLSESMRQLREYFRGERRDFDLELKPEGTAFQRKVWNELSGIRYGSTVSYGYIASKLGCAGAARAVGRANGLNPIAIIIPCHRVIGADGSLTGYASGLKRKRFLLELEGVDIS